MGLVASVGQVALGGVVRVTDSGLGCPDWPLCYGHLLPPAGYEIALETGHRFVAALLGLLIITIAIVSLRQLWFFYSFSQLYYNRNFKSC